MVIEDLSTLQRKIDISEKRKIHASIQSSADKDFILPWGDLNPSNAIVRSSPLITHDGSNPHIV